MTRRTKVKNTNTTLSFGNIIPPPLCKSNTFLKHESSTNAKTQRAISLLRHVIVYLEPILDGLDKKEEVSRRKEEAPLQLSQNADNKKKTAKWMACVLFIINI
jgi:hypothetical protein